MRKPFSSIRSSSLPFLVAIALFPGCRSATQDDLIAREMRQQEDQIYALQDYLADYERVLCQVRSENASLRQALAQREFREDLPSPRRSEPTPPSRTPSRPTGNGLPDDADPIVPDVPPLELPSTSSLDADNAGDASRLADDSDPPPEVPTSDVVLASYEEPTRDEPPAPAASVALLGEVAADGGTSGPRVRVKVVPLAADGESTEFDGELSLMFLVAGTGIERELARWDFSAEELPQFAKQTAVGTSFEFPLQLPPGSPTHAPVELWVRLVPRDGGKLLGQASVDLSSAGRFAAGEPELAEPAMHVASTAVRPTIPAEVPVQPRSYEENGWSIARAGEVTAPPIPSRRVDAQWRVATQPMPVVESRPPQPDPLDEPLDAFAESDRYRVEPAAASEPSAATPWTPERPGEAQPASPTAPAWSPNR